MFLHLSQYFYAVDNFLIERKLYSACFINNIMHLSMLRCWGGGRPGIGGGFESSHRPVVGMFDRFNGLSSNILLTY